MTLLALSPVIEADVLPSRAFEASSLGDLLSSAVKHITAQITADGEALSNRPRSTLEVFEATQHGPFDDLIIDAARRWRLDPFLFKGLLANESKLDPVRYGKRRYGQRNGSIVVISGGAIGIAQFTGGGIRAVNLLRRRRQRKGERVLLFDVERAMVPSEAIPAAAELLAHLIKRFGRDGGITAYNSGVLGGLAVHRLGFWRARRAGKLSRVGIYMIQGHRFLLNVLRRANWYRRQAGLPPLVEPDATRPSSRRLAGKKPSAFSL